MRRPRALTEYELLQLDFHIAGRVSATVLKSLLAKAGSARYKKYNNYIRWRKRELRRAA